MDKSSRIFQPFSKNPAHRRQFSDSTSTYSYCSLTPSTSRKNLNLDRLHTEASQSSSKCASPVSTHRAHKESANKAISLVIIEKYFSDICQNIANKNYIEKSLLAKAGTMQDVLKDCLTAVPDISLQFYVLMASALKEIQEIYTTQDSSLYSTLAKKLVQVAGLLEENNYTSDVDRVTTMPNEEITEVVGLANIRSELNVRIARVTARILDLWKKILSPQREAAVISCSFILLYCEVDGSLKILPTARIPADKAVNSMKLYLNNPGYVVTVIRKTKEYIENEQISVETVRRINDLLEKVTVEQVKNMDKTLTGFAIYELILYAVKYYQAYAKDNYKIDIFDDGQEKLFESDDKGRASLEKSPGLEEVKIQLDRVPRVKTAKIVTKSPEKSTANSVKSSEKPVRSPEKVVKPAVVRSPDKKLSTPSAKFTERSRIIEKNARASEKPVVTHNKTRSALYSPASATKDNGVRLQRNNSNSSTKNLLTDRKSLNIFRK